MILNGAANRHALLTTEKVEDGHTHWPDHEAVCSCGWRSSPHMSRSGAERYHAEHLAEQGKPTLVETIRETLATVEGWQVPLTPDQRDRLHKAADALASVAYAIDQENRQKHGAS